jgi:hypothetical protein
MVRCVRERAYLPEGGDELTAFEAWSSLRPRSTWVKAVLHGLSHLRTALRTSRNNAKMSHSTRKPLGYIETGSRNIVDAQQIVDEWRSGGPELGA